MELPGAGHRVHYPAIDTDVAMIEQALGDDAPDAACSRWLTP